MYAATFLVGALVAILVSFADLRGAALGFLLALCVTSLWPAALAYRNVMKGVVFNPADRTIVVPASQPASTPFDYLSFAKYRELLEREIIPLSAIRAIRDRDVPWYRQSDIITTSWYLDIEGTFGLRTIRFRDPDKRAEAQLRLGRLMTEAQPVPSRIPRTGSAGVPPAA